jgi:hypothetical protein
MKAFLTLDQSFTFDASSFVETDSAHHRLRRLVVHLGGGDHGQVRMMAGCPLQRRAADLRGEAPSGQVISDSPSDLQGGLAFEIEATESTAADQSVVHAVAQPICRRRRRPIASPYPLPSVPLILGSTARSSAPRADRSATPRGPRRPRL